MTAKPHPTTSSAASSAPSALTRARQELTPATDQEWAVLMARYLPLWDTKPGEWQTRAPLYRETLADLPADLLAEGIVHCAKSCKFFPKPAEIRAPIEEDLKARVEHLRFLEIHSTRQITEQPPPKPTTAEKAAVTELLNQWRAKLPPEARPTPGTSRPTSSAPSGGN